jgi:hypothetical protein
LDRIKLLGENTKIHLFTIAIIYEMPIMFLIKL